MLGEGASAAVFIPETTERREARPNCSPRKVAELGRAGEGQGNRNNYLSWQPAPAREWPQGARCRESPGVFNAAGVGVENFP